MELIDSSITNATDSIRQGTIFKFSNRPVDETYGIIVTADCDIANQKHGKYLSYCYIIPLKVYITDFLIQRLCRTALQKKFISTKKEVQESLKVSSLSDDALLHLINEGEEDVGKILSNKNIKDNLSSLKEFYEKDFFSVEDFKTICKKNEKDFSSPAISSIYILYQILLLRSAVLWLTLGGLQR